jgi:hypothetical protein
MKAHEELQYKANYKLVADFLTYLCEESEKKDNLEFLNKVLKAQELHLENWNWSNENCNEIRLLNNVILEQGIELLKKG